MGVYNQSTRSLPLSPLSPPFMADAPTVTVHPVPFHVVGPGPPGAPPAAAPAPAPAPRPWTTDVVRLLRKWARRIHARERAHAEYADQYSTLRSIMGVPTAMFTGTSSVGGFLTYRNCDGEAAATAECAREESLRLTLAVLSTGALITSQLQTFYNFGKLSDRHKTAADNYSALYHKIEAELEKAPAHRNDPLDVLHDVRTRYDKAQRDAPQLRREPSSEEVEGEARGGAREGASEARRGCGTDLIVLEDGGTLSSFLHQMRVAPRGGPRGTRGMQVADLEAGLWSIPFEEVLAELDNITPGFELPRQGAHRADPSGSDTGGTSGGASDGSGSE